MQCAKEFFAWQADWWMEKGNNTSSADLTITQGMVAYAHRQSHIRQDMLALCVESWKDVDAYSSLGKGLPVGDVFLTECY